MEKVRKHLIFHGEVQGVGFRWNAVHIARKYGISGWVRNLYDGTVEMEAEGTPLDIAAFIDELKAARWVSVEQIDERTLPLEGSYEFTVR